MKISFDLLSKATIQNLEQIESNLNPRQSGPQCEECHPSRNTQNRTCSHLTSFTWDQSKGAKAGLHLAYFEEPPSKKSNQTMWFCFLIYISVLNPSKKELGNYQNKWTKPHEPKSYSYGHPK